VVLSDRTIARLIAGGRIGIDPYDDGLLQPSSLDVRVDRYFRVFHNARYPYIDVKQPQDALTEEVEITDDEPFILHPGEFVLGSTLERVTLPDDLVARLEGKALALHTEVPTLSGWKTMGDLKVGDLVFDERGEFTVVVGATPPLQERPCVEMVFSDDTSVVCDESHRWVTTSDDDKRAGARGGKARSAATIAATLAAQHEIELVARPSSAATERMLAGVVSSSRGDRGSGAAADRPQRPGETFVVVDVRPVDSVPVRCIEVSSPRGQFLVTRSYIPTHNSSLGRLGLLIHSTAGFIDPGWDGHVTLELSNVANLPITIYHGMKIGQLSFMQMTEPASAPYGSSALGSKYQGQRGPTPSRYWQNFGGS
jgi:deoxycytidine triphosphate deaminase